MHSTRDEVRSRLLGQTRDHWLEFAVIVASVNLVLALQLSSSLISDHFMLKTNLFIVCILIASTCAVVLAYYSIQSAVLVVFGPLRITEVLLSFLVAIGQISLFVWPSQVLSRNAANARDVPPELRHWLLFYAVFAFSASLAGLAARRRRKQDGMDGDYPLFEAQQKSDATAAGIFGCIALLCWAGSWWNATLGLGLGLVCALIGAVAGISSQQRTIEGLQDSVQ